MPTTILHDEYDLLTIPQSARILGRSYWFVLGLIEKRRISHHVVGPRKFIARKDLEAFIARTRVAARGEKLSK